MADNYSDQVSTAFNMQGYIFRSDPTAVYATGKEPGRSDYVVIRNCKGLACEVKSGKTALAFDDWRDNQRQWYEEVCLPNKSPYWLWLNLGDVNPNKAKTMTGEFYQHRAWLLPIEVFLDAEAKIKPIQKSIPYRVKEGYNKVLQANKWDAVTLFEKYELTWEKLHNPKMNSKYGWKIADTHPFALFFNS